MTFKRFLFFLFTFSLGVQHDRCWWFPSTVEVFACRECQRVAFWICLRVDVLVLFFSEIVGYQ